MNYAHPEVLVDTEWLSQNPPNENRKLVEVDYDPVNGYQKGWMELTIGSQFVGIFLKTPMICLQF